MRKKIMLTLMCFLGLIFINAGSALALSLDFSASVGDGLTSSKIVFTGTGDTITFTQPVGGNFNITSVTSGTDPDTQGLLGNISGTFTIGAITTVGSLQTAPVTGTGTFSIKDELANTFSATLTWVDIYTMGAGGGLNSGGTVNLSSVSYAGVNTDLLAYIYGGISTLTFQFIPGKSLTQLTTDGTINSTSFSGSLAPVPVPGALGLLGSGLIGLVGIGYRRKA
jgi:hypothetical protein